MNAEVFFSAAKNGRPEQKKNLQFHSMRRLDGSKWILSDLKKSYELGTIHPSELGGTGTEYSIRPQCTLAGVSKSARDQAIAIVSINRQKTLQKILLF